MSEIIASDLEAQSIYAGREKGWLSKLLSQFGRIRVQLTGGVLIAIITPLVIRHGWERLIETPANYHASLSGTLFAFLLGFLIFRKLTSYPGIKTGAYIVPAFVMSYGLVILYFFFLRLDYSRFQFLLSLFLSCGWFLTCFAIAQSVRTQKLAVARIGQVECLREIEGVDWTFVSSPDEACRMPLVLDLRASLPDDWERSISHQALEGRPIYNVKQVFESLSGRVKVEHLSETKFGTLAPNTLWAPAKLHFDWLLAVVMLVLTSPLMIAAAILIRLESKGPAIFRQKRMGFQGRPFTIYKFRSMREQDPAAANLHSEMTQSDDDRITRFGRFIRKTRIDELPQIFNILRGEMSWIGPRPEAMKLSKWYEDEISFYSYRHLVRPGITGWAQVNQGHITSLDDAKLKLEYDFFYVRNLSLWLDLLVVLQTIKVVFTGKGAK